MRNEASERQVQAADPNASTWLSANAGSGKTKVLIDRVARLLLSGVKPQHVLCLTYTKAAAAEMQNRLFRRLGEWAMMPDHRLMQDLSALGDAQALPKHLSAARQLFASAIDTPGGLRIQTIHSFCAMLLRRFPLEAGVSPQFVELDDRAGRLLRDTIVQDMADRLAPDVIAAMARAYTGEDFAKLMDQTSRLKSAFANPISLTESKTVFSLPASFDRDDCLALPFNGQEVALFSAVIPILMRQSETMKTLAILLARIDLVSPNWSDLKDLYDAFLYKDGGKPQPSAKTKSVPTANAGKALGDLLEDFHDFMNRVASAHAADLALSAAEKTAALHAFAAVFLPEYTRRKIARGWLDFDDLITHCATGDFARRSRVWVIKIGRAHV